MRAYSEQRSDPESRFTMSNPPSPPPPSGTVERVVRILETLAQDPQGMSLADLAADLDLPRSGCHRLLADLQRCGYVRQVREHGDYALTTKLPALGLSFFGGAGIVDIAQPI